MRDHHQATSRHSWKPSWGKKWKAGTNKSRFCMPPTINKSDHTWLPSRASLRFSGFCAVRKAQREMFCSGHDPGQDNTRSQSQEAYLTSQYKDHCCILSVKKTQNIKFSLGCLPGFTSTLTHFEHPFWDRLLFGFYTLKIHVCCILNKCLFGAWWKFIVGGLQSL